MTSAAKPASTYDEYPYPGSAFWFTHPDHLAVLAEIHGIAAPHPRAARVLELGCGDGANIVSIAASLPGAECVGVDLSASQVRIGNALIQRCGLTNIRIVQGDVIDMAAAPAAWGQFDYIIAHGLYSWVPAAARDAILRIIAQTLAPTGAAMVSYNALPGGHDLAPIRTLVKYHTDPIRQVEGRIRQARSMAEVYLRQLANFDPEGREAFAERLNATVNSMSDHLLRHDWLSDNSVPFYFADFIATAQTHGLDFLCNAAPSSQDPDALDEEARTLLLTVPDRVRRAQYYDFFQHTRFRATVLRRAETAVTDTAGPEVYADYAIESRMDSESLSADLPPQLTSIVQDESSERLERERKKFHIVSVGLARHAPAPVHIRVVFEEIARDLVAQGLDDGYAATPEGREDMFRALCGEVGWLFGRELVALWKAPPSVATELSERPSTGPLQRALTEQTTHNGFAVSLLHRHLNVTELEKQVLAVLDGTLTQAELTKRFGPETGVALRGLLKKGFLVS